MKYKLCSRHECALVWLNLKDKWEDDRSLPAFAGMAALKAAQGLGRISEKSRIISQAGGACRA